MASIFARIIVGEIPCYKVAEDENHLAFLDVFPLVKGHVLVIPKKETDYLFDIAETEYLQLMAFSAKVAKGIKKVIPCRKVGVAVVGLEVPHAHIHLIPVNQVSDMNFAREKTKFPDDEMSEIATQISSAILAL
jgi:histidine triad (HIT) family protein